MIEIFKTDVRRTGEARHLVDLLLRHFPGSRINFDLDDCDKILRVEGINFKPEKVIVLVKEKGFDCKLLE